MKRHVSSIITLAIIMIPFSYASFATTEEPQSPQAKSIKALVDKAAELLESKGKTAFSEFKKRGSEWNKGETYVVVHDMNGTLLMHPIHPEGEGQNYLSYRDINGKAFFQEALNMLKTQDSGWIDYMWPKPGYTKPVKKTSYFRKAKMPDGQTVVVAGGYYIQ